MTFENLSGLTNGKILSTPDVSSFTDFVFDAQRVKQGDLYIALDDSCESVKVAIDNGANGILYDCNFEITDSEIAWIKVENITSSLIRIMRLESSHKKIKFVLINTLQESIIKSIQLSNAMLLPHHIHEAFLSISKIENETWVFASNASMLEKIAPTYDTITDKKQNITIQKNGSLFLSSFIHNNKYYQKLPISPFFVHTLSDMMDFLQERDIGFSLDNFSPIKHFEPIFVDSAIIPQDFGSTRRALIIESDENLFYHEAKKLSSMHKNNNLVLTCKPINSLDNIEVNFLYKNEKDLKDLRSFDFRYALVYGDKEKILRALSLKEELRYPTLF